MRQHYFSLQSRVSYEYQCSVNRYIHLPQILNMAQVMQPHCHAKKKKKKRSLSTHGLGAEYWAKFTIPEEAKGPIPPPDTAVIDFNRTEFSAVYP
jgi:hypothetical protein